MQPRVSHSQSIQSDAREERKLEPYLDENRVLYAKRTHVFRVIQIVNSDAGVAPVFLLFVEEQRRDEFSLLCSHCWINFAILLTFHSQELLVIPIVCTMISGMINFLILFHVFLVAFFLYSCMCDRIFRMSCVNLNNNLISSCAAIVIRIARAWDLCSDEWLDPPPDSFLREFLQHFFSCRTYVN